MNKSKVEWVNAQKWTFSTSLHLVQSIPFASFFVWIEAWWERISYALNNFFVASALRAHQFSKFIFWSQFDKHWQQEMWELSLAIFGLFGLARSCDPLHAQAHGINLVSILSSKYTYVGFRCVAHLTTAWLQVVSSHPFAKKRVHVF